MLQSFEKRWYQTDCEEAVFDFLATKLGNPLAVLPTGTGKSVILANVIRRIFSYQQHRRIMLITHDEKILKQNAEKLLAVWPEAPLGFHAANMRKRETVMPIIFGMVKSVALFIKNALKENLRHFNFIDAIFIDEAHLVSPEEDTFYQFIIMELMKLNPELRVIGFTATPFRMKQGMLTEGKNAIFTDICYDITDVDSFNRLIEEGYLCTVLPKPTGIKIDTSKVRITAGEFNEKDANAATDKSEIIIPACREAAEFGWNRNAWLVFGSSIENAEHINEELQGLGIVSTVVHSKLKDWQQRLDDFKNGRYQAVVSKDQLTTGFDHPPLDFGVDLQLTNSPGKHVQKIGRFTRPCSWTNKRNSVYLDFAGNVERIGPINDPRKPKAPGKATGDVPIKVCPSCTCYNHASARFCCNCNNEFIFENKLVETSGTEAIVRSNEDVIETMTVKKVIYNRHEKRDSLGNLTSPPSIKVSYFCGTKRIDEWVMFEHPGRMGNKARAWWKERNDGQIPITTNEALYRISSLRAPARIKVITNRQYPEIIGAEF